MHSSAWPGGDPTPSGGCGSRRAVPTPRLLAGVLSLLLLAGCAELDPRLPAPVAERSEAAEVEAGARPDGVPADARPANLDRVVDGDTIRVFPAAAHTTDDRGSVRVRLLNIDAPELARDGQPAQCLAAEAAARLESLLGAGRVVWLAADAVDRDRFDRPLRGVWSADGVFVNEVLAAEGLATSVVFDDNDRFLSVVEAAQARAQRSGRGVHGQACA